MTGYEPVESTGNWLLSSSKFGFGEVRVPGFCTTTGEPPRIVSFPPCPPSIGLVTTFVVTGSITSSPGTTVTTLPGGMAGSKVPSLLLTIVSSGFENVNPFEPVLPLGAGRKPAPGEFTTTLTTPVCCCP